MTTCIYTGSEKEKRAARYVAHRDEIRAKQALYYKENHDRVLAINRSFHERHPDWRKQWSVANSDKMRAQRAARVASRHSLADAAMAGGCVDCGIKDRIVLDFDHVRGKKVQEISQMFGATLERFVQELTKCEVRCANCHRRITARRKTMRALAS